jgi:acyl-CoA reductase-like NAD-dependent aldehyde dehydrogenase
VLGGAKIGSYLANHPSVDNLHMTGSDRTYNMIVWGNPDPKSVETPILDKPFTSELGCVTPYVILPSVWSDQDIDVHARLLAGYFWGISGV